MSESQGIDSDLIPKMATGFCGGMARTSGLCGALTGGIMALSLLFGRTVPQDPRDKIYALTAHLVKRFKEEFGATGCTDILGCDISTPEGSEAFLRDNLLQEICVGVVENTVKLVMEAIAQQDRITHPLLDAMVSYQKGRSGKETKDQHD